MDATTPETPKSAELSLPQAFLLLATNDNDGKPAVPVFALRTTVAGAILAELDLLGAIELQGKNVRATGAAPQTDFQRELEQIRGKSRPHTPKRWVSMLEGRAEVQRVYEQMAARGIVEQVGERHLGLFKSTRYPEKDHGPEAALLQEIEAALGGAQAEPAKAEPEANGAKPEATGAKPEVEAPESEAPGAKPESPRAPGAQASDPRITALIALLHAAGLFGKLFPAADRTRAGELAKDYWPARAVEDELRMIRLAQEEAATL
ncbi:GPP34 family phosphoprotein [Arthrobacter sp. AL12]|uniref:GOLPH3/VPS74 family protein n=1 Tax=Arthrobacter sp. AL12 TaxID=3042241 RepID=UPI00249CDF53|nr:GPP34 family phosphoprotein [Arthrobacter sp. AL12]MDI3212294.1 GPP34 family phosphoprotein [Arthrobacter sp. AL12]